MMKRKTKNAIVNLFLLLLFLYVSGRILYYSLPVSPTSAAIRSKTSKKLVRSSTGPPPPPSVFIRLFPFLSYWFVGRDVNAKNRQYYEMDLGDTTSLSSDHHQRGANSISSTTTSTAKDDEDGDSSPASSVSAAIVYVIPSDLGTGGIKRLYASIRHLFFYFNNDGRYPVLIFMENLNEGLKNDLIMDLTFPDVGDGLGKMKNIGLIRFHKYDLTVPNQVRDHVEATASNQTEGLFYDPMFPQDFPEKCNMENFYFQHIAKLPEIQEFEFIMNISPRTVLKKLFNYDPFEVMNSLKIKYAHTSESNSKLEHCMMLWENVAEMKQMDRMVDLAMVRNEVTLPEHKNRMSAKLRLYQTGFEFLHLPTFQSDRIEAINELISGSGGIYDYSWSASTLRWISVHLSLEVSKEVLGFCDVEYELDGKLIEPSCFTRTEYKASSTNYLKRTLRRIALAPNLVDSDGYEQQQQQKWVEDHDGDQDGVLVLDTPLPIQEKGDRRSMRTSHHKSGGFKKEALGFGGIDEDDNVNGGGGNRKFTKSVKSSSSSSVRRNVILKTDSPLVIVPSTNPPPSSFPQPHIIPSSSSLSFSSSSSSSSTFSKTSSSSELLKLQSDKNKVMNDLLKLAGATPQRLEGDKTIEDEATRRMHGHAVDNLDEHTRNGGKAIDSENNKRGEGVVGGAERRQEPANLIDPGRSNNANSMGDVRGRRVEPIIVAGGGAAGLGGEQQQQQNEQQHQQKHQQPQQPQQSPLSRKINEGGGGEHESDASLREQYAKEEEQRYYAHAGLGGASLAIEEEEEEQEEKDDDENDEIIFGAGGVGDDHAAAAPLVERPRPEVIAIQRN